MFSPIHSPYGAPIGYVNKVTLANAGKVYDRLVPMCGAYDKAGMYFGLEKTLRVAYKANLSFVQFYRVGDETFTGTELHKYLKSI